MAARRRKRKNPMPAGLKRYWAAKRRGSTRKNAPARRKRRTARRRNWLSPGMVVAANPHRRRSRRRSNPRVRHHSRRRRNPAIMGFALPGVKSVLFAGVGFAGPSLVSGLLSTNFPSVMSQMTSMGPLGKYIVKAASVIGLAWATRRFVGPNEANMVLVGGGVNIALTMVNDFAPGVLPANPLGMYVPTPVGMHAYVASPAGMRGMRALPTAATIAVNRGSNIPTAAPYRSFSKFGVASRLMRY